MQAFLVTILTLFLAGVLVLTGFSLTRKERIKTMNYTVLCSGVALYLFGYLLEVLGTERSSVLVALAVENAGIFLIGPFMLLFVLNMCDYRFVRPWMGWLAGAYAFIMTLAILFNESHQLYYTSVELRTVWGLQLTALVHGPLYYVQQLIVVDCAILAIAAILRRWQVWTVKGRGQVRFVLLGLSLSLAVYLLYIVNPGFYAVDPIPFALSISLGLAMVSILHHKLFDIVPAASETTIQNMENAIIVVDSEWCFQSCNNSAIRLFPALGSLMRTESIHTLEGWPPELMQCPLSPSTVDFSMSRDEQEHFYQAALSEVKSDRSVIGWAILITDITETAQLMNQLHTMATTDFLTGIYNRRHFLQAAQKELELARREGLSCSLVLFDLDNFKRINDAFGHQVGDRVLTETSKAIRNELRAYDVFARYGGEEFIIFSVGMDVADARRFAERLCETVRRLSIRVGRESLQITASFGITELFPDCGLDDAIAAADRAMYRAKEQGRDCVVTGHTRKKRVGKSL